MPSGSDGDRHREHLGVIQTKQAKKKKYRRSIDPEDIALPSQRYEDLPLQAIRRARPLSASTPSPIGTSPQLSSMRLGDSSSEQLDAMAGMPPLTQRFLHPNGSPFSTATPSGTPHDTMSALAPS
ncbi:hypothetical protein RDI58_007330 [Solanum bulbocastanum]|uniref:Uncharacterized protein n=1 Tax=Solanum bulbocastanum TaxID=147425 RepID=A0AAN8TZ98_SOLBU